MMLGDYEIPEIRLVPNAIRDAKKIYDVVKTGIISTKEIGNVFGYKQHATGIFYRRLGSMFAYGLITQLTRSSYKVTELGVALAFPEPDKETTFKNKAVLNVKFWNEVFKKFGKNPPLDNFWIQIKNITGMEPKEAEKIQSQIRKWYMDDISLLALDPLGRPISDEPTEEITLATKDLSSTTNHNQMKQQLSPLQPISNQSNFEMIQFDKASLSLPKKDLKKHWEKLQRYMEIFLEDYEEPEDNDTNISETQTVPEDEISVEKMNSSNHAESNN